MRGHGEDDPRCYCHPKEVVVGICALCLKERLLVLASEQNGLPQPGGTKRPSRTLKRTPSVNLRNVFALGSLLQLLDNRYHRSKDTSSGEDSIASLEDSFISFKFEEDSGQTSWPNKRAIDSTIPSTSITCGSGISMGKDRTGVSSIAEHKKRGGAKLRWRKRIGRLLHLARWKRSNKASTSHVGFGCKVDDGF
ncbi:uncharacterized protein LOC135639949 [Musa acuminata AAA Group]|uniref:uncharacterized protein LOC135639949 n=1 Tax=Musa acuminata AAA Group TaxID=214697 RepID=UPI0031D402CC